MKGQRDSSIQNGYEFEDKIGIRWVVESVISKPDSNGVKRKLCVCKNVETGLIEEKRYDTVRKWFNGKMKKNSFETNGDVTRCFTSSNKMFLIDTEDLDRVNDYNWSIDGHGYVVRNRMDGEDGNVPIRLHRFILGVNSSEVHVDHHDHDKKNNRKDNLRITNNQNNSRNKGYARSNTGYIGVSYNKRDDNYQAHIKVDYKKIYLGTYKSLDDALIARLKAEKEHFKEFAPQKNLYEKYGV